MKRQLGSFKPFLHPVSPSPHRRYRKKRKATGTEPKGYSFSHRPCCLQYMDESSMYGAQRAPLSQTGSILRRLLKDFKNKEDVAFSITQRADSNRQHHWIKKKKHNSRLRLQIRIQA